HAAIGEGGRAGRFSDEGESGAEGARWGGLRRKRARGHGGTGARRHGEEDPHPAHRVVISREPGPDLEDPDRPRLAPVAASPPPAPPRRATLSPRGGVQKEDLPPPPSPKLAGAPWGERSGRSVGLAHGAGVGDDRGAVGLWAEEFEPTAAEAGGVVLDVARVRRAVVEDVAALDDGGRSDGFGVELHGLSAFGAGVEEVAKMLVGHPAEEP